jgi:hypothetical protein
MTAIRLVRGEQKEVDIRCLRHKIAPLTGHTEHPQLAGQPELTLSSSERRLANQTTGACYERMVIHVEDHPVARREVHKSRHPRSRRAVFPGCVCSGVDRLFAIQLRETL